MERIIHNRLYLQTKINNVKILRIYKGLTSSFINYKQAYDSVESVDRETLWKAMIILGILKKYVNLIKKCYEKTLCRMHYLQGISDPFEVKSGLKQGDALSLALFNLTLKKVIRHKL